LLVRARYEQLTRDRPDSALAYWDLLRTVSPAEALAYEGMAWTLRALGRYEEAAAAADTAMTLEPSVLLPSLSNAIFALQSVGDTARALALSTRGAEAGLPQYLTEARFYAALMRGDFAAAATAADTVSHQISRTRRLQQLAIATGDLARGRAMLDTLILAGGAAEGNALPSALLLQGWAEARLPARAAETREHARNALGWVQTRDLSPPAVARLLERVVDVAARNSDTATISAAAAIIDRRDRGRSLPSYALARKTVAAGRAYAAGDYAAAARLAYQARIGVYFSRSMNTLVVLEADALRAAGDLARATELYSLVGGERIADGDYETWMVLRAVIRRELRSLDAAAGGPTS
jgi:hypothetical protein